MTPYSTSETHNTAARAGSLLAPVLFTTPYLKGKLTQLECKLENYVASTLATFFTPSPSKAMLNAAAVVQTRKTSVQQNIV